MQFPRQLRTMHRYATTRPGGLLSPSRAAARLSAYVYGNVLVMAVVVAASTASIDDGSATALAVGTTVTTFLAHVFSDAVAESMLPDEERSRRHRVEELRDSLPIASSGTVPTVLLGLGWLQVIPTGVAQVSAAVVITVRIAAIPLVTQRLRGEERSWRAVVVGIAVAFVATLVVLIKVVLTH